MNAVFWHSRSFILHLCSSLSSVQMIVTLPVTFFKKKNNSYNPGKTKLSGRGLGGNFKSLRFHLKKVVSAEREKFFDGKVTQLLNFVAYSVLYAREIKPYGNIKAEALRHKKRKKNCV